MGWSLSRFVCYYNIHIFLTTHLRDRKGVINVLDFGGSAFLNPFKQSLNITKTVYPGTDMHASKQPDDTYDIVAADQVLEHTQFPHMGMLEIRRILKKGGIAIITTCAYNPVHDGGVYHDYWRFMLDGLRMLSLPFEGGIRMCGGWGTGKVIGTRATQGILTSGERKAFDAIFAESVMRNDAHHPFVTWIIMQK